jgi:hypothetical protein
MTERIAPRGLSNKPILVQDDRKRPHRRRHDQKESKTHHAREKIPDAKRCERDGLELERMWLGEDDIEPNTGEPAVIEQPTSLVTRPLNPKDEDDRVRIALGLTGDDPLPGVDDDTLRTYHRYLAAHLAFPFEARWEPEYGPRPIIKITGLGDADDACADEMYGLLCEARVEGRLTEVPLAECEAKKSGPNRQLLKDYAYWFWNNR